MPLYNYKCYSGHEFDEFNSVERREVCKCPECGTLAEMQITPVRIDYYNMGVRGDFPTCAQKWEKMHKVKRASGQSE